MTGHDALSSATPNPFVGPRPLEKGQPIFGRDIEISQLYDLLCAERIVLLRLQDSVRELPVRLQRPA